MIRQKWEYLEVFREDRKAPLTLNGEPVTMEQLGQDGWELVASGVPWHFVFARPLDQEEEPPPPTCTCVWLPEKGGARSLVLCPEAGRLWIERPWGEAFAAHISAAYQRLGGQA